MYTTGLLALGAAGFATFQGITSYRSEKTASAMLATNGALRATADPGAYRSALSRSGDARRAAYISGGSALALGGLATFFYYLARRDDRVEPQALTLARF